MAFVVIIVYNAQFIMNWIYLFLESLNFKNENLRTFVKVYSYLVCKHKNKKDQEDKEPDYQIGIKKEK